MKFIEKDRQMKTHHMLNQQQYQNKSEAYLKSSVHAQGIEFIKMQTLLQQHSYNKVLDLGCGGGHVSYHLAPYTQQLISCDLNAEMVNLVIAQAKSKGLHNIQGMVSAAETLPFIEQDFDCIVTRYSAHHWHNVPQAMSEMYRVLADHGRVVIFDVVGSCNPIFDSFLQTIEMIRDPSHVRDYSVSEWAQFAELAGFRIEQIELQHLDLDFKSWVERMQTPEAAITTIASMMHACSDEVKKHFQIKADASFTTQSMYMVLSKPGRTTA